MKPVQAYPSGHKRSLTDQIAAGAVPPSLKLTRAQREYFVSQGRRGGETRAKNMTDAERIEGARIAAAARKTHGACSCARCGHEWRKRIAGRPGACPKCHCLQWDKIALK